MLTRTHGVKTSTITAAIGFAVIAALLSGCAATPDLATPGSASSASPSAALTTGAVISMAQAEHLLGEDNGQRGYPMADGTFVVVTKTEPLPAEVQADAEAKAHAILSPHKNVDNDMEAANDAFYKAGDDAEAATGKDVIIAVPSYGYALESEPDTVNDGITNRERKSTYWIIYGGPGKGVQFETVDEVNAVIVSWLAKRPDANEYAVIVTSF
jgi:hypothetical protein